MKLVWKGKFKNVEQLMIGDLPQNAVKFKEPNSPLMLNLAASIFAIPVILLIVSARYIKGILGTYNDSFITLNLLGILLGLLAIIPHEFIHALSFPKKAEVQVWYTPKNLMAFVFSTHPVSKLRFIFISLMPNIVFGFIPLVIWVLLPAGMADLSYVLFSFAAINLLFGAGDYLNVFNAAVQIPGNAVTQLYGFNSYWYLPQNDMNT